MGYTHRIINSLAFRTIIPVIIVILLIGIGLYISVFSSVSKFTESHMKEVFEEMSRDIYAICDANLNELLKSGMSGNEKALRVKKGITIGKIEDFMKQNNLHGSIIEKDMEVLRTSALASNIAALVEISKKQDIISSFEYQRKTYYVNHIHFEPWEWHIFFITDAPAHSTLLKRVKSAYGLTGGFLFLATALILYFLNRYIGNPIKQIIDPIKKGNSPDYAGIYEFEFLSDNIRQTMDALRKETRMLNNIYHIAVSRKGEEFFDEVVMAISRTFGLNSIIARIAPDGENAVVAAMYYEGALKKGMNIPIKDIPRECEYNNIITKKHIAIIEKDAYTQSPFLFLHLLPDIKADSCICFAVFDRKGNVIGIIEAFGKPLAFKESDIKVLQTIGQMVATEFERLDEEKEKEHLSAQLFQTQKMEAIGTLAGGIAHDFNNTLQGILGYASLLKMKIPESDPIYKPLSIIEHSAERAAELTKQLLGFARKGKYVLEPINLNEIVNNILELISRTFDRAIEIKTTLQNNLWLSEGDKSQIEHSILNLCLNARDAMPAGGTLHIETRNTALEEDIPHPWMKAGKYVVIKVIDTGMGMDEEIRKHIFEPFFTTKEIGKGIGMGLAMVYGIVKNHNGFITVDSELGRGATFTIYLPKTGKKSMIDMPKIKELPQGKGTILIVDDEETVRIFGKKTLEDLGYYVLEASDGAEAVEIYRHKKEAIDLIILDLIMPKMNGKETLSRLKKINPDAHVLISSGYGIDDQIEKLIGDSTIDFIQKPYNVISIADAVNRAISAK